MRVLFLWLLIAVCFSPDSFAGPNRHRGYRYDPGGTIEGITTHDVNGDGRPDVVLVVRRKNAPQPEIVVVRTPAAATKGTFFPSDAHTSYPCGGRAAKAGVVAVGPFRDPDTPILRFLGPDGVFDLGLDGKPFPLRVGDDRPLAYGRSGKEKLHFAEHIGPRGTIAAPELSTATVGLIRGMDADFAKTLSKVPIRGTNLATRRGGFKTELKLPRPLWLTGHHQDALFYEAKRHSLRPSATYEPWIELPFMAPPKGLTREELHTARVQFADVDGDGTSDILVTLLVGRRDRLGSLRTILFHYDGATVAKSKSGAAPRVPGEPRCRIDTESVALHPRFVDLNGDGALDYVCDSVRGTMADLFLQVMGKDPIITFTGFLFDPAKKTFSDTPYFTIKRVYPSTQALSNRFGQSAWFDGDFDGDGHKDLLDLGNLSQVVVLKGERAANKSHGDPCVFETELIPALPVKDRLEPHATILDFNADGRVDALMHSETMLYILISETRKK